MIRVFLVDDHELVRTGLKLILEPGRNIIAPAGVLLSQVIDVKPQSGDRLFAILDAGMTELIRPMLYNAFHRIEHVNAVNRPDVVCDSVGPLCESSDTLGKERTIARPEVGDLMAVRDTGAAGAWRAWRPWSERVWATIARCGAMAGGGHEGSTRSGEPRYHR